ncbi:MAG TPA: hypothetical protein DCR94_04240 [Firmicutes bacterium]|nr:hypothetical protein [Bacillota bacterium]
MKKNKGLLLSFLRYDWWKIIGTYGICAAFLALMFNYKDKLKDEEILDIFITGTINDSSFQQKLFEDVPNDKILAIHSYPFSIDNHQYNQVSNANISSVADLFILPESVLNSHREYFTYAKEITDLDNISSSYSFLDDSNFKNRGIKIFDKDNNDFNQGKLFSSWFDFSETSYLFVSSVSTNSNDKNADGKNLLLEYAYSFLRLGLHKK